MVIKNFVVVKIKFVHKITTFWTDKQLFSELFFYLFYDKDKKGLYKANFFPTECCIFVAEIGHVIDICKCMYSIV